MVLVILTFSLDKAKWKCSFVWHLRKGCFVKQLSNGWRNVFSLPPILKGFDPQLWVIHLFLGVRVVMNVNMFVSDTVYFGNLPLPICFISIFHLSLLLSSYIFLFFTLIHSILSWLCEWNTLFERLNEKAESAFHAGSQEAAALLFKFVILTMFYWEYKYYWNSHDCRNGDH